MVVYAYNLSSWVTEQEDLHFEDSLNYLEKPVSKKKKEKYHR
jgi:hypothetical protein